MKLSIESSTSTISAASPAPRGLQQVLDNIGNRLSSTSLRYTTDYIANSLNQYTNVDASPRTYDADGNMLQDARWTYTWNGENRLVSISNAYRVLTFKYDYMGRRFRKVVDGDETTFLYDGWNLIQESSPTLTNHYVWGLDLSGSLQGAGGVGGLLSRTKDSGERYLYNYDANGNVTELVDGNGLLVVTYVYDAFGNIIANNDIYASGAELENRFKFSTKYQDDETALSYYGFRYYDAEMGRWLSRDPIGENGGLNLWMAMDNMAVNITDFLGLSDDEIDALEKLGEDDWGTVSDIPHSVRSALRSLYTASEGDACECDQSGEKRYKWMPRVQKDYGQGAGNNMETLAKDMQEMADDMGLVMKFTGLTNPLKWVADQAASVPADAVQKQAWKELEALAKQLDAITISYDIVISYECVECENGFLGFGSYKWRGSGGTQTYRCSGKRGHVSDKNKATGDEEVTCLYEWLLNDPGSQCK